MVWKSNEPQVTGLAEMKSYRPRCRFFFWLVTLLLWSAMCQRYPKVPNASNKKIDCCAVKVSSLWDVDRRVAVGLFHVCRVLFRSIQRFLEDQRKARTLYQFMLSFALQHVFFQFFSLRSPKKKIWRFPIATSVLHCVGWCWTRSYQLIYPLVN